MTLEKHPDNLIWIDLEMTGLSPETDRVLEIAIVVSDPQLEHFAEAPVWVIHQDDQILNQMDNWNKGTHGRSGLIDKVKASTHTEAEAETQLIDFLKQYIPERCSPMCGNTICQDRRFLARYLPKLENYFHYRNLDVSTLKELSKRWAPEICKSFTKQQAHTALADVYESIEELKHYRQHFLKIPQPLL